MNDEPKEEFSMLLIMSGKSCRKFELLTSIWVSIGRNKAKVGGYDRGYWQGGREEGEPREYQ